MNKTCYTGDIVGEKLVSDAGLQQQVQHLSTVNRHLRLLADQISEGAMIVEAHPLASPGPRIMFVNRALCRLTGHRPEEVLGRPLGYLFDPEKLAEFLSLLPKVAEAGKPAVTRARIAHVTAGPRPARWTVSPVHDPADELLNFIITIAVEEAAPVEELDQDRLHQFARLENLETIASGIAHDFRNQLTSVMLNVSNAGAQAAGSPLQGQFLERASAGARQAKDLADQLMEFARGGTPVTQVANVGSLLQECAMLALSGTKTRGQVEIAPDLWAARLDKPRIRQIFNNLLINATQAMPDGGHLHATARNATVEEGDETGLPPGAYVTVSVQDRGPGIPEHLLPNIFKRNFTTKATGNGLGLASSYHIARAHEGTITIKSRVNAGTEFLVWLPACPDEALPTPPPAVVTPRATVSLPSGSGCILIVEDQHIVRAAVKASVEALGYEAEEAATGEEAIARYERRFHAGDPFRLVLMDLTLPGGHSGDDALRAIRQLDPAARVIAASGAIEPGSEDRFCELGYITVLPKPFDLEKLSHTLHGATAEPLTASAD